MVPRKSGTLICAVDHRRPVPVGLAHDLAALDAAADQHAAPGARPVVAPAAAALRRPSDSPIHTTSVVSSSPRFWRSSTRADIAASHARERAMVRGKLSRCVSQPTPSPSRLPRTESPPRPVGGRAGTLARSRRTRPRRNCRRAAAPRPWPAGRRPRAPLRTPATGRTACFWLEFISRTARSIVERGRPRLRSGSPRETACPAAATARPVGQTPAAGRPAR